MTRIARSFTSWSFAIVFACCSASLIVAACGGSASPTVPTVPSTSDPTPTPTPTGDFFESSGARLSYVIDRPTGTGPVPGIVMGHEGGVVTKDQLAGMSATLVQRGFAVLRYDKRGTGFSTGGFNEVTTENSVAQIGLLAADMVAAVRTLKSAAGVDPNRIGFFGVSQAGWVMPLAASQTTDVKFIAAVVGPTVAVGPLYYYAGQATDPAKTFDALSQLLAAYGGATGYDPRPSLQALSIPMLYQMATTDRVVPTRESIAVLNTLIAAGKPITVMQYPGGHELRETQTFVADLLTWLDARK